MCREGTCGSCVVSITLMNPSTKKQQTIAVNSCLLPVLACHGCSVTTVEGVGSRATGYDKVQTTLAHFSGTQCGFCSPGFVMTMHSLLQSKPNLTAEDVESSFSGNLCRCTGYRPILDAFKSLSSNPPIHLQRRLLDIEECHNKCNNAKGVKCSSCILKHDDCEDLTLDFSELSLCEERLHITGFNEEWYRVANVREIFEIFDLIRDKIYFLVAGNTSKGVQVKAVKQDPQVYIDINNVPELKEVKDSDNSFTFGSGTTIANLISLTEQLAARRKNFIYTAQIAKHLKRVANAPVRNRATVGGNLHFAHEHHDFPSDVFLLLDAVSATINLERLNGLKQSVSPTEFLRTDLNKTIIRSVTLQPTDATNHLISYKVMQTAQSVVATVNGAFFYSVSSAGILKKGPTIVFSGINDNFRRAFKTEEYLKGKNIHSKDVLQGSLKILSSEVVPEQNIVTFSPEYRKQLALSLYYKSLLNLNGSKVSEKYKSGSNVLYLTRPMSSGKQVYNTDQQEWPLTEPRPKLEALIQCSGEALFQKDIIEHDMLFAKFVLADKIGDIASIDASKALAMTSVKGFFMARDIPGENNVLYLDANDEIKIKPLELLCSGKVLYWGQPVGLIVASNEETAWNAAKLVKITYKSLRNPIFTTIKGVLSSQESKNRVVLRNSFKATKTGSDQKYKFSGELSIGAQYNHAMETQTCVVTPLEDGQFRVNSSSQSQTNVSFAISNILGISVNKLDLETRRVGGAFGSKVLGQLQVAAGTALAAFKFHSPVKMSSILPEDITIVGKRESLYAKYQGSVNDKGDMQSLDVKFYVDMGCQMTTSYIHILDNVGKKLKNFYDSSTWNFECYTVITDKSPSCILRSPMYNSAFNLIEEIMDHVAFESNNDPVNVRLINSNDPIINKYISDWRQSTEYNTRKEAVTKYNKVNRWKKRGISLCAMKYFLPIFYRKIGCSISILWPDASIQVIHGGTEMGQGINTKVAQVVAHELGIDLKWIQIKSTSSHVTPNNSPSQGSISSDLATYAALRCCQELNSRIEPVRKTLPDPNNWKALVNQLYTKDIDMNVTHAQGFSQGDSPLQDYYVYGVAVTEVEVDVLTGEREIRRVDLLEDIGKSLNPSIDVGQVEGAYVMGLGLHMSERVIFEPKTGKLLNNNLWSYKIPTSKDIPVDFRVTFIPNSQNKTGVFGSKGTGEPALVLAIGVVNAFRNAVMDARNDAGQAKKWLLMDSPVTIETLGMTSSTTSGQFTY